MLGSVPVACRQHIASRRDAPTKGGFARQLVAVGGEIDCRRQDPHQRQSGHRIRQDRARAGDDIIGQSFETQSTVRFGKFSCNFPQDFSGAPKLSPMLLYVDATDVTEFGGDDLLEHQAEVTLILSGGEGLLPELPLPFTDDFIDAQGRKDMQAAQWPQMRSLVNLFMHGRAAKLMGIDQPEFDLAKSADFEWFKEHATLYDFDHRDRDWSQPLNHRIARGFWQAMWNTWFNPQNNHPWDGNREGQYLENVCRSLRFAAEGSSD